MANHKSAEKRHRQSLKRRESNREAKAAIRTALKKARAAVSAKDVKTAKESSKAVEKLLAKAATKGIMRKTTVRRYISRLATSVSRLEKR